MTGILIGIIAPLILIVAVLLWNNLRNQQLINDKNEAIIREIRKNIQLRDELNERRGYSSTLKKEQTSNIFS